MQQIENIQLNPIMEPLPVAFSLETFGWKILFFLVLIALFFSVYKFFRQYKNNQYRREAITKIQAINSNTEIGIPEFITKVMFQLKQTALYTFGRKKVASLEGEQWLKFLAERSKNTDFNKYHEVIFKAIYKNEYLKNNNFSKEAFVDLSIKWIKNHA